MKKKKKKIHTDFELDEDKYPASMLQYQRDFEAYQQHHPHSQEPVLFLEAETGFNGIAGRYRFPREEGWGRHDIERQALAHLLEGIDARKEFLQQSMEKLQKENPCLTDLRYDANDAEELYHAVMGVVSDINVSDINYFLEKDRADTTIEESQLASHMERKRGLEQHLIDRFMFSGEISWLPSPETLDKMEAQLEPILSGTIEVTNFPSSVRKR